MRITAFFNRHHFATTALITFTILGGSGCGNSEIKTYRIAKEDNTPKLPSHEGHDHGDHDDHSAGPHGAMRPQAALPKLSWDTPNGWQALPAEGMRKAMFQVVGPDGKMAQVMVIPLPGVSNIELQSVNMWREELGLPGLTESEMNAQAKPVSLGDAPGHLFEIANPEAKEGQKFKARTLGAIAERENILWFAKMTGTDDLVLEQKQAFTTFLKSLKFEKPALAEVAAAETPASTNAKEVPSEAGASKWNVPANWQPKAPGPMVTAAYSVGGTEGAAEVTVSKFPGDVGGMVANVNRWRSQLGLPALGDGEAKQSVQLLDVGGKQDSYLIDVKGTNSKTGKPARLVAVGIPRGGETWFYKFLGDDSLVGKEKDTFLQFATKAY